MDIETTKGEDVQTSPNVNFSIKYFKISRMLRGLLFVNGKSTGIVASGLSKTGVSQMCIAKWIAMMNSGIGIDNLRSMSE